MKINPCPLAAMLMLGMTGMPSSADTASVDTPLILLCADTTKAASTKLVYGYLDGKKTACMTEPELRSLYTNHFNDSVSAALDKKTGKKKYVMADLHGTDFSGANLAGMDMTGANFTSADLRKAVMKDATLINANLMAAYLRKADLRNADLSGANLTHAYLSEADLTGATGITIDQLKSAKNMYKAKIDTALLNRIDECCPEKLRDPGRRWDSNEWKPADKDLKEPFDQKGR
jgi:hypothetical protein